MGFTSLMILRILPEHSCFSAMVMEHQSVLYRLVGFSCAVNNVPALRDAAASAFSGKAPPQPGSSSLLKSADRPSVSRPRSHPRHNLEPRSPSPTTSDAHYHGQLRRPAPFITSHISRGKHLLDFSPKGSHNEFSELRETKRQRRRYFSASSKTKATQSHIQYVKRAFYLSLQGRCSPYSGPS